MQNTTGKGKETSQRNLNRPASDVALREYCDKHYNQFLPFLAEKMHLEKVQQEKPKEREGESTEDFMHRFKIESRDVKWAPKVIRISGFMHGITNPELIKRLHDKIPKSVDGMMRITTSVLKEKVVAPRVDEVKIMMVLSIEEKNEAFFKNNGDKMPNYIPSQKADHVGSPQNKKSYASSLNGDRDSKVEKQVTDVKGNTLSNVHLTLSLITSALVLDDLCADNILEKFKVIFKGKVYMARAKELFTWTLIFWDHKESEYILDDESFHGAKNKSLGSQHGEDDLVDNNDVEGVSETFFGVAQDSDSSLSHPLGFTPEVSRLKNDHRGVDLNTETDKVNLPLVNTKVMNNSQKVHKNVTSNRASAFNYSHNAHNGGSILEMLDNMIRIRETIVMGDFNEVRSIDERFGLMFNQSSSRLFNHFITSSGLADVKLEGYSFTWAHPSATKMSKLDRFLVSEDTNGLIRFKKKLQDLKKIIRSWIKDKKLQQSGAINSIKEDLLDIDKNLDIGNVSDEILLKRMELTRQLHDINQMESKDYNYGENKSPGLDGYTFEFFRRYWRFIGSDFCSAIECFFKSGSFSKGNNSSFIALIPKVTDAKFFTDFGPISLIGCVYKVVTKILANLWLRLTLLKSVLGASPLYDMSIYKVPKGVLKEMEAIRCNFFNGADPAEGKIIWVSWDKVLASKKNRGLRVPSFICFETVKESTVASKLGSSSIDASFRRSVRDRVERQQLDDLNSVSGSITLSASKDRWICDLNGDGVFRVKEVRTILDDIFLPSTFDATRWVKYIPIKINVFAWCARLDRLPTRSNLVRRRVVLDFSLCSLCGLVPEDIHHVLLCFRLGSS
nr:RNA-directed DNA polymerase, eukaryota [Tanacetum cinerariifolium]